MEDDLVDPIQKLWSETSDQVEIFLLLLRQAWKSLPPILDRPEVGQSDTVSRKLHCVEPGGRANNVVDVNLMDEAGFYNVTAPGFVLPIRPVNNQS